VFWSGKRIVAQASGVVDTEAIPLVSRSPGDYDLPAMPLPLHRRLGPYEILTPLGSGGMGEVYRAHDARLGRDVAVKGLSPHLTASPDARARFEREARTISQLNHPHICTLHDIGHQEGMDYLVMELLEGETLAHRLEKGPLPVAEVLSLGGQIADALDVAHRHGIVHRDLKPGNVMLTRSGAKLMDFGFARTDLWALGCVLYEMATGKRAFEGARPGCAGPAFCPTAGISFT
jgi:serine/threonine protein kinase